MSKPKSIFGAALLGMSFNDAETVAHVLDILKDVDVEQIDTAPRYPPFSPGKSECLLGAAYAASKAFKIDSKVVIAPDNNGEIGAASIRQSVGKSLGHLGSQKLGVVGFQPDQLQAFLEAASTKKNVRPLIYQGEYNVITRGMEKKILPLLRAHNMAYYAHCPLAAGFLTGNFTKGDHAGTRFAVDHPLHHIFHQRYDVPALHEAVNKLEIAGRQYAISVCELSLRWIFYHSVLGPGDGVITGCTSVEQIRENARGIARGPLPEDIVESVDEIWNSLAEGRSEVL